MADYISKIFERANLQNLRSFLMDGLEAVEISPESYKERLKTSQKIITKEINERFSDKYESDKIMSDIFLYASVNQDVYMEIGIKCGAMLTAQLLNTLSE